MSSSPGATRTLRDIHGSVPAVLLGVVLLSIWFAVTRVGSVPAVFLPAPDAVIERLYIAITRGHLLSYAWVTIIEALLGCLAAAAVALPLAWALHHWRLFDAAVRPYVAASQAVPAIAIAPLLVLWVGYGTFPIIVLCALMVFFPIVVTVLLGLRSLDADVIDAAKLDGAHGLTMLLHMELPMTVPAILSGLRTAFTLSVTGAVVGEFIMGGKGLGQVLSSQRDSVDTTGLFSTIVLLCSIAVVMNTILHEAERRSSLVDSLRGRRAN